MTAPLPSCCAYHADQLPTGCQQGTLCPARAAERARRAAETPEPDAWAQIESLIKPIATYGALILAVFLALALILAPNFIR